MDINSIRNASPNHDTASLVSSSGGSGPRNLTQSEVQALKRQQNETHRQNLINVCRMCIKSLVDMSTFQSVQDDNEHLINFCIIVEYLFLFRLLPHKRNSWFGPEEPFTPWSVVSSLKKAGHNFRLLKFETQSIHTIEEMCVGCPPITKFRAWLRLTLLEKRFAEYYTLLASNRSVISHFYETCSCFEGEFGQILSENFKCLNSIDFLLCLKDFSCPGEFNLIIDFSPYLSYRQTPESQAADELERSKLPSGGARGGESNLEEMLRKEREQKLFYEEVIRSREEEIQSLQEQNSELTAERTEKQQIILELQRILGQTQTALRESQQHQEKKNWIPNLPNMSNLAFMRGASDQIQNSDNNRDNANSDFVSFGAYTSGKVPQDPDLWSRPLEENAIRKKTNKSNHSPNSHTPKHNSPHTSPATQHTPSESHPNHVPHNGKSEN